MKTRNIIAFLLAVLMTAGLFCTAAIADAAALNVSKTIEWTEGSENATVTVISDVPEIQPKNVLFLGTLCGAHHMSVGSPTNNTITQSLDAIAVNNNVDFYMLQSDGSTRANYTGHLDKGQTIAGQYTSGITIESSGNHAALKGFVDTLNSALVAKSYDYIVLEFDASRIAASSSQQPTRAACNSCADKLASYYANNQVIWITDGFVGYTGGSIPSGMTKSYGVTPYTPTNVYYYGSDNSRSHLTAAQFHNLCALVAPSYYQAKTTENAENYGNGSADFTLSSSYSLTQATKVDSSVYASVYGPLYGDEDTSTTPTKYWIYDDNSRQTYYDNATGMSKFLFMVIQGISLKIMDNIKVSDDDTVQVTSARLYVSTAVTVPEDASGWTEISSLTVTGAAPVGAEGSKYVESTDKAIRVTTGNTVAANNNKVSVSLDNIKNVITFVKLEISLSDSKKFISCVEPKKDAAGAYVYDGGNIVFEMNPNLGNAEVDYYSAKNSTAPIATGSAAAAAPIATTYKVTSTVTNGTQGEEHDGVTTSTVTNPVTLDTYKGDTVKLTYTPSEKHIVDKIIVDGNEITLGADGTYTGTDFTVKKGTDGKVVVEFADLAANHTSEVQFKHINVNVSYQYKGDVPEGAAAQLPTEKSIEYNSAYNTPSAKPELAGYTFCGWYTDTYCSKSYTEGTNITEDTILYGKWEGLLHITKKVDTSKTASPVHGGDDVTYLITIYNDGPEVTGVTVTDRLDTSIVSAKSTDGGTVDASGLITWSNLTIPAKTEEDGPGKVIKTLVVTVRNNITRTADGSAVSLINFAKGELNGNTFDSERPEIPVIGRDVTVKYSVAEENRPSGYEVPADVKTEYGSNYNAVITDPVAGYEFKGWYNDAALTDAYDSDEALTEDNYDSLKNGGSTVILYGKWDYCVGLKKELATAGIIRGGDTVTYNIRVKNSSSGKISGVSVSDTLPTELSYVEGSAKIGDVAAGSYDADTRTISWSGVEVEGNSETVVSFQATITDTITGESTKISNTANGSFDGKDLSSDPVETPVLPKQLVAQYNYVGYAPAGANEKRPPSEIVEFGSSYTAAGQPSVDYYTFEGWYSDKECTAPFTTGTITDYDRETNTFNLYGKWTSVKAFTVTKDVKYNGSSISGATIYDGSTVTYEVTVKNDNPVAGVTATVTDYIPAGLKNVSGVSHSGVYSADSNTVTWTVTLPADGSAVLSFNATAPHTNNEKSYQNTAAVTAADGNPFTDPKPGTVSFSTKPYKVTVSCTKTWSDTWDSHEDETVQFKLTGSNGYSEFFNLTKTTPSFSKVMDAYTADGTLIEYSFAELDTIGQPVAEGEQRGDYIVTSTVNENSADFVNTYRIKPADLNITKTADETAVAGKPLTYTLTVENTREYETALNVLVEDQLPEGLTLVEENGLEFTEGDTASEKDGKISWTIATLGPKQKAELKLTVLIPKDANIEQYENVAVITGVDGTVSDTEKPSAKAITDVRSFSATVEWYMSDMTPDYNHPATGAVQLKADGSSYGEKIDVAVSNEWHNLYTYDGTELIVYTVTEDPVEGYETKIYYYGSEGGIGNTSAVIQNIRKTVPVSYKILGADQPAAEDITPQSLDLSPKTIDWGTKFNPAEKPTAKYHDFAGWYADESCTVEFNPDAPITSPTVIYGKWTRRTADIIVVKPDEGPANVVYPEDRTVDQGTTGGTVATPSDPNNDYTFNGWYTDPACTKPYDPTAIIEGDVKLYPKWTKNITVTYSVANPPEGAVIPAQDKLIPGTQYTSNPNHGSNAHYTFMGWYTDLTYTQKYTDGTVLNKDTVLYGKWVKNPVVSYVIVGTGPSGKAAPAAEEIGYGKAYNAAAKLTYTGYTFSGWYIDPACTIPYVNGTVLTADITLYGKWTVNNSVATGDDYNGLLYIGMVVLSAMAIGAELLIIKKRRLFG